MTGKDMRNQPDSLRERHKFRFLDDVAEILRGLLLGLDHLADSRGIVRQVLFNRELVQLGVIPLRHFHRHLHSLFRPFRAIVRYQDLVKHDVLPYVRPTGAFPSGSPALASTLAGSVPSSSSGGSTPGYNHRSALKVGTMA